MNYKELLINNILKHKNPLPIDLSKLEYYLWYTCTKQSYIQRTDAFDNNLLIKQKYNSLIAIKLLEIYNLDELYIYENSVEEMDNKIKGYDKSIINKNIMFIHLQNKNKTLFYNYYDKIRNTFAHGTFNNYLGKNYYLGQRKSDEKAEINFLMQTNKSIFEVNDIINSIYNNLKENINLFLFNCIKDYFEIDNDGICNEKRYYSNRYKKYIIIDTDFIYKNSNHISELRDLLDKYTFDEETVIIITEKKDNISDKNLTSYNGLSRIVFASDIIDYFEIKSIHLIK